MGITATQLRQSDAAYKKYARHSEQLQGKLRDQRNELIRQALAEGWTQQRVADALGVTRGRINQLAGGSK